MPLPCTVRFFPCSFQYRQAMSSEIPHNTTYKSRFGYSLFVIFVYFLTVALGHFAKARGCIWDKLQFCNCSIVDLLLSWTHRYHSCEGRVVLWFRGKLSNSLAESSVSLDDPDIFDTIPCVPPTQQSPVMHNKSALRIKEDMATEKYINGIK